jgi:signal transduction histidine kinase
MDINFDFMQLAEADVESTARRMMLLLTSIGVIGVFTAMVLGRRVQQAIAPRIEDLVLKIKRFQELGVHERMFEEGEDEIALLANAIDAGFAAIAARAREREQFLAIVAHELKTPVTSIQGFAEAALVSPNQSSRALEVIKRQSNRLGRLIDDLLWAARARYGDLPFCPVPVDLAFLVHKITREIDSPIHPFRLEGLTELRVLADEGLMTHALVSLFTYAIALSAPHTGIVTRLGRVGVRARTDVYVQGPPVPSEDIVRIFDPFSVLQYESDARPRTAVGLFLCREILRLHGGSVHVADEPGVGLVLTLEMPA